MKMRLPVQLPAMLALLTLLGTSAAYAAPTTTNGQISEPGERDRFSFRVDAERTFYFDALTEDTRLQWSLSGPRGTLVDRRGFNNSDSIRIDASNVLLPLVPGDYTLTVQAGSGETPAYAFRWVDLTETTPLTLGTTITNVLTPATATALYQFPATAGDQVRFNLVARTNFNGRIRLFGPAGGEILDSNAATSAVLNLPTTGNQTLLVEGDIYATGVSTVVFNLESLGNVPPPVPDGTPILLGATVTGTTAADTTNAYTLNLPAPARLVMDSLEPAAGVRWSLSGPDGLVVSQRPFASTDGYNGQSLLRLSAGVHQIRVSGTAGRSYGFRLLDLAAAPELVPSTRTTNTFATSRETLTYRFNGTAGSRWYHNFLGGDVSGSALLRIVDPFGGIAFETTVRDQYGPLTLNFAGQWTVLLEGYVADAISERDVVFQWLPVVDGFQPLTLGSLVSGAGRARGRPSGIPSRCRRPAACSWISGSNRRH